VRFDHTGPPITEHDLEPLERLVGCRLPEDYRAFLLKHNGGTPRPSGFQIVSERHGSQDVSVEGFYHVGEDGFNLELSIKFNRRARDDDDDYEIPADAISIGSSEGADILVFVRGVRVGQVWLKDHEEDHGNPMEGMTFLASSFDEFLKKLVPGELDFPPHTEHSS
jgi:hypothetical protein